MSKLSTAIKLIKNDKLGLLASLLVKMNFFFPDRIYLRLMFFFKMKHFLNLNDPETFSEKLQWLKLYDRKSLYTMLVDKYDVKEYVAQKIGMNHVIPTIGLWNEVDEIDFDALPKQYVLKTTNGSGGGEVLICRNAMSFDSNKAKKILKRCLKKNVYKLWREWPYKNIPPRIIAEKYMEDESGELKDYKFYCFNGMPKFCQVIRSRFVKETIDFYDLEWNHMPFVGLNPAVENGNKPVDKPLCLNAMIEACNKLSFGIPFVRVDFYVIGSEFYFGEMTFYPASGFGWFRPNEWNYNLGKMIDLSSCCSG